MTKGEGCMFLSVCHDSIILNFVHNNYVICFYVFMFLVLLILFLKYGKTTKTFIFLLLAVLFVIMFPAFYINKISGCYCNVDKNLKLPLLNNGKKNLQKFSPNKVIVIGDSRMELIEQEKNKISVPNNYLFIAKSGASLKWFKEEALPRLYNILDNKKSYYKYYVVINMGVNDVQYFYNFDSEIIGYLNSYHSLLFKYLDVDFYILSINPVIEKKLNIAQPQNIRTTEKVEYFNTKLANDVYRINLNNYVFCDAYHDIHFNTDDGLHYTIETDQDIVNYISNKCINFK